MCCHLFQSLHYCLVSNYRYATEQYAINGWYSALGRFAGVDVGVCDTVVFVVVMVMMMVLVLVTTCLETQGLSWRNKYRLVQVGTLHAARLSSFFNAMAFNLRNAHTNME